MSSISYAIGKQENSQYNMEFVELKHDYPEQGQRDNRKKLKRSE